MIARHTVAACALALVPLACTPSTSSDAGVIDAGEEELINPPVDAGDSGMPPVNTAGCPTEGPFLAHADEGGGVTRTTVTACTDARWVGLDLDDRSETLVGDPPAAESWDIAFQRFHVKSNGGVSGTAGVRVAPLTDVAFEDVSEPPADGWREDQPDSDLDGHDDYVISGQDPTWWEYDLETHVISMTGVVWVVESNQGRHYKLELVDYYADVNGSAESGYPTFKWAPLGDEDVDAGTDAGADAGDDDADDDAGPRADDAGPTDAQ